jgi:hypothetical protein
MFHCLNSVDGYKDLAGVTRLELAASGVTGRRSNQLSYTPSKPFLHLQFNEVAVNEA